ncbi:MAG: metallophosphoesterase [Candidatus Tectomicrobia bacterium]|uniref:Metallophosphoesterase n=1 Tax=Tectimicrobiota bacterium TaxID=2528274 RepID=A0A933GLR0_UNCTE|nr:metallophosphoesterase [Candidatus Tectomicrobia bacterium]
MSNYGIIHLSDLHIGESHTEAEQAKRLFTAIAEFYPRKPILITGDLTDSGTERQMKQARKLLDGLAKSNPILLVPGNHDYAYIGNICHPDAWGNWMKYLGFPLGWDTQPFTWMDGNHDGGFEGLGVWKDKDCVFIGIDSGDPKDEEACARGYISQGMADAIKSSLKQCEGKTRIAFLHHHPFTKGPWNLFTALKGHDKLLQAVSGNCELLLFGHEHNYGVWREEKQIPLIVASHKSTQPLSSNCYMITLIDIEISETQKPSFHHRLEVI